MTDETKEDAAVREAWTTLEFARCTVSFAHATAEMRAVEAAVEARTRARLAARGTGDGRLRAAAEAACEALWTSLDDRGHCAQCDAGWAEYDAIRATLDDITDEARRV